jgi:hypothetical protein
MQRGVGVEEQEFEDGGVKFVVLIVTSTDSNEMFWLCPKRLTKH